MKKQMFPALLLMVFAAACVMPVMADDGPKDKPQPASAAKRRQEKA